nr:LuxR C-terminal-related transcriptional regulator [Serratia symbiotica]
MNIVILDDSTQHYIQTYPLLLSIYRRDSTNVICNKLHEALTHFCQQPWLDLHVGNMWKCQQCRIAALSNCEKKVLRLMSTGMSACTIANMLHRSQKTISTHKRSAMRKLNLRKNAELSRVLLNQMGLN